MHPVPGFLILPFLGSNLACDGFSCLSVIVSLLPPDTLLNRALIFSAASFFISSVLCRYISSVVLLDTCPRMVDKVLMSIPFATDVVAKVWRRSWNRSFLHSVLSNISLFKVYLFYYINNLIYILLSKKYVFIVYNKTWNTHNIVFFL